MRIIKRLKKDGNIPALSMHAPWAWAIVHAGKHIENRTWKRSYRGPLFIHASLSGTQSECDEIERKCGTRPPADMIRGAIIARATLSDIVPLREVKRDPWASGPWCWILQDVQRLRPQYMPGKLGLWKPVMTCR
jgi:ASCH domain